MSVTYLIDEKYIPEDGSKEIINNFAAQAECDIIVYPDVHYKKGAQIANGMLVSSDDNIYLSCLGVENCGYTFGVVHDCDAKRLVESFREYASTLKDRKRLPQYTQQYVRDMFNVYLTKDYYAKKDLYDFLGIASEKDLLEMSYDIIDKRILNQASKSLCTLGGGNHFFEIHQIQECFVENEDFKRGDFIYALHSDSIAVGDIIYELFSDLHEMLGQGTIREKIRVARFRNYQKRYFKKYIKKIKGFKEEYKKLIKIHDVVDFISAQSEMGKLLILAHNISSIFGEMNRDEIIKNWMVSQNIQITQLGSHSHDNISIEKHKGEKKIVHRNGVQNITNDKYCFLPSAMGNYSFIMGNTHNEDVYYSTNHGTGRMEDKHIAKSNYTEIDTNKELEERNVSLFRVGNGNIAEQNMKAFKDPDGIIDEMEKFKLAKRVAKTYPVAVIKG